MATERSMGMAKACGAVRRLLAEAGRLTRALWRWVLRPGTVSVDGIRVPIEPDWSRPMVNHIYGERYEGPERRAVARLIGPEDRVLELGSAIGVVASVILRCGPAATRHYEANPAMIAAAERTLAANGLAADLRHAAAVGEDHEGDTVSFNIGVDFWSSSLEERHRIAETVTVPAVPLSAMIAEFAPSVIVMDIEGAETRLLMAPELPGVRAIVVEMHRRVTGIESQTAMLSHLFGLGFHLDLSASEGENLVLVRDL